MDSEGTVRDLATYDSGNNTTTVVNHRVHNAFGVLESQTNSAVACQFGYTGRPSDQATGLQNNGYRWYEEIGGHNTSYGKMGS